MKEEEILTIKNLINLKCKNDEYELRKQNPDKEQEFILWRGVRVNNDTTDKEDEELMSSLQLQVYGKHRCNWTEKIGDIEKNSLNKFLEKIAPHKEELEKQYLWFKNMPSEQDTVWILSVMQHYGFPTRFLDFTADFWAALFFATDGAKEEDEMVLYSFKCKNEDKQDKGGNKVPKDDEGEPHKNSDSKVCINDFLGRIIGYGAFNGNKLTQRWDAPKQSFGWERPAMMNARIEKQKGFFVYPVDITRTLKEVLSRDENFKKYRIKGELLSEIKNELEKRRINSWSVYLDIERAFKEIKGNLFEDF